MTDLRSASPGGSRVDQSADDVSTVERLAQGQAISRIGTWDLDPRTGTLVWSDEMFRVYGNADAGVGRPEDCLANVLPDDQESTRVTYAAALAGRRELDFVHRVQDPAAGLKHVRVRGRFTYADDGTAVRAVGTAQDVTDLVNSQAALRASEARLRATLHSMAEGFVVQDRNGRVTDANPAACEILGLTLDEILGRKSVDPRWQSVHEDGTPWPGLEHPAMWALRAGLPQRNQLMGVSTPQGELRWIRINAMPIRETDGDETTGVIATFVDVTGQRQLEARLSQTVVELADLYERAPCGYHLLDSGGRFIRINATELAWLGCEREEVIGKLGPIDFLSDRSKHTFRQNFPALMQGAPLNEVELELIGRHGARRWVSVSATPVMSADGGVVGARSVMYDISELHRVREDLRRVNAEQAAVLDTGLIGIVRVRRRRFEWVSDGASRVFGYAPGELVGQRTRVLYANDADHERIGDALRHRLEPGQVGRFQFEMVRKDGSAVWIDLRSELLSAETGESLGVLLDITASKRAEAARIHTAELAAENAQLAESSRVKNEFLANMSHELRTPLNAVIGFAHLLQDGASATLTPTHARYLRQIGQSGQHLLGLVQQMLDFAQASSGRMTFEAQTIDVRAAIEEVEALLAPARVAAGVTLSITVDPLLGMVANDRLRLRQMVFGLVENAVKFSGRGDVVDVRAYTIDAGRWGVAVEDHGIGIAPEDLQRLFLPFVQISAGLTKTHEGMGIGLALVRKLARAQGGDVQVRSRLGAGSVFSLELPREVPSTPVDVVEPTTPD